MSEAVWMAFLAAVVAEPGGPKPADRVPEIVVTGERVPKSLRDTASSVDVTTADRIDQLSGADRIEQVLEQVPNVVLGGGEGPAIRGQDTSGVLQALPAFLGGTRPRTTLQVDGRAVSFNEFVFGTAGLWDVERVEVFRTPQTTTQGHNSIAGAIFVHSNDPTYNWEARGRAIAANYRTRQASAVLSGPIIADQLAFRVAADARRGRPSVEIADRISGADPNNDDYRTLRFKLLGEPRFWRGSRIELTYAHFESLMPGAEIMRAPFRERRNSLGLPAFRTNVDSVTAMVEHPLAKDLRAVTTLSFGEADVRRFSTPGLGETDTDSKDLSIEALIDWDPAGSRRITGGVAHRRFSLDQFIDLSRTTGLGRFDDEQRSLGLFGEFTFEPVGRLIVTAGLRYQWDRQRRSGSIGTPDRQMPLDFDGSFSAWLPKLSVAYDLLPDLRAGLLVQRAYNQGGTTLRLDTGELENFGAETLWNYELFARGRFAGGSLSLAGNLFYTAMRDAQRFRVFFVGLLGLAEIYNVPRARSYGAELTADWRVSRRLSVRAALGLLDTKTSRTRADSAAFQGKALARSPGFTASASVDWQAADPLRLSAQLRHHSSYFSDDAESRAHRIGPATLVDARASWTAGPITLFGYVRNLFDTFRLRFLFTGSTPPTSATAHDPREFGIGLEGRF